MFKALILALAAAAGWTVSGQAQVPSEPTSPLPMLSMQNPEAPQAPESAPAAPVVRLGQVDAPKMVKRQKPKKAKAPKQAKVRKKTVRSQGHEDNARQELLNQIQLLQAENSRLQDALEHKRESLNEVRNERREQRARAKKNERLHAEHKRKAQAETRALSEEARALKLERRALGARRPQEQAARALEHRELALEARKIAAIARAQTAEHAEISRGKVLEHRRLAGEAALIEIEAQKVHAEHQAQLQEIDGAGPHMVHLRRLLEGCKEDVEGCDDEIEVLVESLEGIGELLEVRLEGLEGIHELSLEGIEGLAEVLELHELSEVGELVELRELGELFEDGGLAKLQELGELFEGGDLTELRELGELFEGGELAELQELGSLKAILKNAQGGLFQINGLDEVHLLHELHELDGLGELIEIEGLEGLDQLKDLQYLFDEQDDCDSEDCCDEGDDDCCDDEQDREVGYRTFFSNSGKKSHSIRVHGNDGECVILGSAESNPESRSGVFQLHGSVDSSMFGDHQASPTTRLRGFRFGGVDGLSGARIECDSQTISPESTRWSFSVSPKGKMEFGKTKAPSGKGCSESTDSTKTSCGNSVINIDNNGGQIFIGTQDGKTLIDCGSGQGCAPKPTVPGRVIFSTTCPPAPVCPPTECKTAPACEAPAKSNSGVSMGVFPRASITVPTALPATAMATYPEAVREYVFASQTHAEDATLTELEHLLSEVLREVDALQIEVDRVRTTVNKNLAR